MQEESLEEIPPNAVRRKRDSKWNGCFSLQVDLDLARTGFSLSKGIDIRPIMVSFHIFEHLFGSFSFLDLRGQNLELQIIYTAQKQLFIFSMYDVERFNFYGNL